MSALVIGTVQWGMPYGIANASGEPDDDEVSAMLREAWDAGVSMLDAARSYGRSEERIGALLPTDGWRVVTKIAADAKDEAAVMRSLRESRTSLRRSVLDTVLFHRAAQVEAAGGALWALLRRERASGSIRSIGVSANTPQEALGLVETEGLDAIQVASSVLDRRLLDAGFFQRARARGVTVFVRSVFLQGAALLEPERLPAHLADLHPVITALRAYAKSQRTSVASLLLRWARDTLGAHIIVGAERAVQLRELLDAWKGPAVDAAALERCAPVLADAVLTPSLWPPRTT